MCHKASESCTTDAYRKKYPTLIKCPFRLLYHRRDIDDECSNYVLQEYNAVHNHEL